MPNDVGARAIPSALLVAAMIPACAWADVLPPGVWFPEALAEGVAAAPRLSGTDPATARINAALDALDRNETEAMTDCPDGEYRYWERWVEIPNIGGNFFSVVAHTSFYCPGAAHPSDYVRALTFDLASGEEIDWAKVFPATFGAPGVNPDIFFHGSRALTELYTAANAALDEECRGVVAGQDHYFIVYPDALAGGLVVVPVDLAHAVSACADPVALPPATLRAIGVTHPILDALTAD